MLKAKHPYMYHVVLTRCLLDRCEWEKHRVSGEVHPTPREGHRSIEHNGRMYIFGGHNSEHNFAELYCWDIESMQFFKPETSGPTPPARAYHSMVKLGKVCTKKGIFF